jgi:hypothetical protein
VRWSSENTVDGPRTSLSAVDERMPGTLRVSRVLPELFSSGVVLPDSVVDPPTLSACIARGGGDEETRTPDPLLAKEMLCRLSYVPAPAGRTFRTDRTMVGVSGLEPETSALSGQCSNQLS